MVKKPQTKPSKKAEQTANKRRNGQFAPGNKIGNRFKPGESGNLEGRPKRTRLTEALLAKLAETTPGAREETVAERVAQVLINEALSGNVQAIREIGDRTEGKPRQAVDIDMSVMDWRELATAAGVSEQDVITEARRLIESTSTPSDAAAD